MPLLSISGCGGGGNGVTIPPAVVLGTPTPTPPPTPTPTPTPGPTPFPPGTTFEPNYLSTIGSPSRWPSFPLTVYFDTSSNPTPERRNSVITGFNQWVTSTANRVRYTVVNDPAGADITVTFTNFVVGGDNILGLATVRFDPNRPGVIANALINIAITGDTREDVNTAAHEFGHSLGIIGDPGPPDRGHSPNAGDLMFFTGNNVGGCACITPNDLNTLFAIYRGEFPVRAANARRPAPTGPLNSITISRSRNQGCSSHHH